MSMAFEITAYDVQNIMADAGHPVSDSEADTIFDEHISLEDDRITKAALYGLDIAEQTRYAYKTIKQILVENKILPE